MSIFKKKNSDLENNAKKNCITAIDFATNFNKKLDYSKDSISDIEEILDFYSKDIPKSNPTQNQILSMSLIFGSYLGETLLKNGLCKSGFRWGREDSSDIPLLIRDDGAYITPVDRVYKRLINGSEDSVVSFYKLVIREF